MLLCRTLRDEISTKEYEKNTCGGTIIWVTSPVCIRETVQCLRSVCKKLDTKESRAIKITKQTFHRPLMVFGMCVHKLGEFVHDEGNSQPSHPEILEATNHLTVHGGIDRRCGIEFERDAGEPEKKRKGSNLCVMPENPKQKKGIESRRDAREPESKQRN